MVGGTYSAYGSEDWYCTCKLLVRKPEEKRPFLRPRRRVKDNIKNGPSVGRMGGRGMDSSGTDKGQVAGCCEHGNEPSVFVKCGELLHWLSKC